MKKVIQMRNLECAHCASKMEQQIAKLEGVNSVTISFMTQKMTVEFEDSANEKSVMKAVLKACKKVEPDCEIEL